MTRKIITFILLGLKEFGATEQKHRGGVGG